MRKLLVAVAVFFTLQGFSQNFDEKPYTFIEKQVLSNLKKVEVKNNLPAGYSIALEESEMVVAEKTVNGKIYDIKYFYKNSNLVSIIFTQHSSRIWKVLAEIRLLKFEFVDEMKYNNIETTIYSKKSSKLGAILICNNDTRILTGAVSKTK